MKFKPLKTSKLFYKKWPYKIECVQAGSSIMYRNPEGGITHWVNGGYNRYGQRGMSSENQTRLIEFNKKVTPFYKKDIQIRVEGSHFNIFCKDKDLLNQITKDLDPWITAIHGPASDEELEFLMSNGHKKRVCNQYPKEKYHYRIYLRENTPATFREKFYSWFQKYDGKIAAPPSTCKWLNGEKMWIQAPYIYVEDSSILSMVTLFLGNHIKIIEEFILRSSINTKS